MVANRRGTRASHVAGKRRHEAETKRAMTKLSTELLDTQKRMARIGLVPATPRDLLVTR